MSEKCETIPAAGPETGLRKANITLVGALPDWVPSAVRLYLAHTENGLSLRQIARAEGVHASTVLRQVRRFESRRDDPLIDHLLGRLRTPAPPRPDQPDQDGANQKEAPVMTPDTLPPACGLPPDEVHLIQAACRLLPLLAQEGAVLVVAADMEKAVILRDPSAGSDRLAVLDRPLAEAFALRDWIDCRKSGRVAQYGLAPEGRAMLRRAGPRAETMRPGDVGAQMRGKATAIDDADGRFRPPPESPVAVLARRRDKDGKPFLPARLVAAAERLREDFEIAQMEPGVTQGWSRMLTAGVDAGRAAPGRIIPGATPAAARARITAALADLGSGLGDVALRCCCWQEGIETAEQKLGWSARSGKIVLRIALDRLARHYDAQGEAGKLIG